MKQIFRVIVLTIFALTLAACTVTINLASPTPGIPQPNPTMPVEPTLTLPLPTVEILLPTEVPLVDITVYFMNEERFNVGTEPYEVAVTRSIPAVEDLPRAVLDEYFAGPTQSEISAGLRPYTSGFTHVRKLTIENGIARVYLGGICANNGAAYSVAALIMKNLSQFPEISAVKIYDENDSNLDPDSNTSSLPYCLEP